MSFNKVTFTVVATMMLVSTMAHAFAQEGHGGNIVACAGQDAVVLDYYHATLPTLDGNRPQLVDIQNYSSDEVIDLIQKRIANRGYFKSAFSLALQRVGPLNSWLSADLKSVDDSNEPYILPPYCFRKTAAIRQENVTMFGDPNIIHLLSPAQQGILLVHEALYLIASDNQQTTSENVRTLVRELLRENINQNALDAAIRGLGIAAKDPTYTFETVTPGVYGYPTDVTYQVTTDIKMRLMKMVFAPTNSTGKLPDPLKILEFSFDASSLQGHEVSQSGCDYIAEITPGYRQSPSITLKPRVFVPGVCPVFLNLSINQP